MSKQISYCKVLWCYPLVVIAAQLLPIEYSLATGIAFVVAGISKRFRIFLIFGLTSLGYLIWVFASDSFAAIISDKTTLIIIGRLGLIGYILLFALWERFQSCNNGYLRIGKMKEVLKFPVIWWGFNEYVWRFALIFCSLCLALTVYFCIEGNRSSIILYGLLFAVLNSVLENVLWRGFILGRAVDFAGEKQALFITSLAFGVYHISLGFSIWICLAFAIGGFYFGGCAIKSKGLCAPIIMQIFVNMVFVSIGIIF